MTSYDQALLEMGNNNTSHSQTSFCGGLNSFLLKLNQTM